LQENNEGIEVPPSAQSKREKKRRKNALRSKEIGEQRGSAILRNAQRI
jgi:hypothetical protein